MEKADGIGKENGSTEEKQSFKDGSICGYSSLHHLLSANLKPQLYQSSTSIMSEMPTNSDGSSEQCKAGPDFFSFYAC
ncbi:hypothetical protein ERO13_D07G161650v2 [Gossypium hirsutum]|uniref:Uncharacterized protein n=1 Tax=Gossypium tomentosum TaxID=34277 RepID=A0A5D2K8N3_GOSTO|nr:hypothetical protein ERO13_D07G161650v2 [Gossypium hirsutum]TYH63334.1 hypothetical protein ES332_D07G184800v1 [Gossypium tomentosum]